MIVDEYHTLCVDCKTVKENFLFAPKALTSTKLCRKCVAEQNAKKKIRSIPSQSLFTFGDPEKSTHHAKG